MNTQLVESLVQAVRALSAEERSLFDNKVYGEIPYPSTLELAHLSDRSGAFDFLKDEPDLYTLEDGEPIEWD
ncbi:hypothetical protein ACQ4M3_38340 [Leptolyngbya sp. AN03gr2]|uniref:hypothetical protein n=1 Tax=unclassified Leptolyngbya TaxID=2650499 RepID=UPI003D3241C3